MNSRKTFLAVLALLLSTCPTVFGQLAKPTVSVSNIGWGWFDLKMSGNSITPTGTHWLIVANGDTEYAFTSWRKKSLCDNDIGPWSVPNDYTADARDLFSKHIVGCADNTNFVARVRYTDGKQWSPFSDPIPFQTPPEPTRTDDTTYVLLYGHSLAAFNGVCGMLIGSGFLNSAGDGYDAPGGGNGLGHALQTELRRITGKTITIINWSLNNTRQSRWLRSGIGSDKAIDHQAGDEYQNFIKYYRTGDGRYLDTKKYKVAVFFFGQNDARAPLDCSDGSYPVGYYISDASAIINELTGKGVRVVYNSLQYATPKDCNLGQWDGAPIAQQESYYRAWDSLTTAIGRTNGRLWRGLDFYKLFKSDTLRFRYPDGIHLNLSEGLQIVVDSLARIIVNAIDSNRTMGAVINERGNDFGLSIVPNPASSTLTLDVLKTDAGPVTLEIVDVLGRSLQTFTNSERTGAGGHWSIQLDVQRFSPGTYFCRMISDKGMKVKSFQIQS